MVKVFLAESEETARRAIREAVDWKNEGYVFSGEAGDGEKAYERILEVKPDILITDVILPFIDGFELSRLVKEALPDIKIIILSQDEKFEYVRLAISMGVSDYLIKPVSSENLLFSLSGIKKKIESEQENQKLQPEEDKSVSEDENMKKMSLLNDLLYGTISAEEAERRAYGLGIVPGTGVYRFLIFRAGNRAEVYGTENRTEEIRHRLEACAESVFPKGTVCFRNGDDRWILLLRAETNEKSMEKILTLKSSLEKMMDDYPEAEYFGGIGSRADSIGGLRDAFETAEKAFSRRFVEDPGQILIEEEVSLIQNKAFSTDNLDKLEYSRLLIERFLVKGTLDDLDSFLDFYFGEIPEDNFQSLLMRHYLAVDVFVVINAFYKKNGIARKEENYTEVFAQRIQNVHTVEDMRKVLQKVLSDTLARRDEISGSKYAHMIDWAERYVETNYMSEDISLNSVAEYVNMNPSYFSSVFRKEKGITFVEYLTRVRLERAKELLRCSSLKISEIAYKVGYNDPQYFSHLFKKYNQCSPKDYRQQNKNI